MKLLVHSQASTVVPLELCDEITYPLLNINSGAVDVWEWISNSIQRFIMHEITYVYRYQN